MGMLDWFKQQIGITGATIGLNVSGKGTQQGQAYTAIAKSLSTKSTKTKKILPSSHVSSWKPSSTSSTESPTLNWKKTAPYTGKYVYNAPMVKDALFNPTNTFGVEDHGLFGRVDLKTYQNVKNAWKPNSEGVFGVGTQQAAKGAFQMDRYLWKSSQAMQSVKKSLKAQKRKVPSEMYGFRFLYNPQVLNMSWGQSTFTNNQALLQGLDTIVPSAPGTMNSSVTFWIPLNRIQDMSYLKSDGSYVGNNPYSYDVPKADRKMIYERGTMYDVEWLMKTINGYAFLDHTSDVSGLKTNDMGFMLQFPIELHLGNAMRYRVQVTDVQVQHIIFNPRMIPIWSTVNFTCRRFPELNYTDIAKNADK
jgi:hypothetical protein